nr:hypothetical protein Iba_chr10bCG12140 [Ipomoea batatas]
MHTFFFPSRTRHILCSIICSARVLICERMFLLTEILFVFPYFDIVNLQRVFVLAPRLLQLHVFPALFQHWWLSERFLGRRQTSTTLLRHLLYLPLPLLHTSSPLTKQSWNVQGGTPITTNQPKIFESIDMVESTSCIRGKMIKINCSYPLCTFK